MNDNINANVDAYGAVLVETLYVYTRVRGCVVNRAEDCVHVSVEGRVWYCVGDRIMGRIMTDVRDTVWALVFEEANR